MDRQWLTHPQTGGYFHCPTDAVPGWIDLGWQHSEAPAQPNPAIAENLAWRAEQAKTQEQAARAAEERNAKSSKPARRGDNQE